MREEVDERRERSGRRKSDRELSETNRSLEASLARMDEAIERSREFLDTARRKEKADDRDRNFYRRSQDEAGEESRRVGRDVPSTDGEEREGTGETIEARDFRLAVDAVPIADDPIVFDARIRFFGIEGIRIAKALVQWFEFQREIHAADARVAAGTRAEEEELDPHKSDRALPREDGTSRSEEARRRSREDARTRDAKGGYLRLPFRGRRSGTRRADDGQDEGTPGSRRVDPKKAWADVAQACRNATTFGRDLAEAIAFAKVDDEEEYLDAWRARRSLEFIPETLPRKPLAIALAFCDLVSALGLSIFNDDIRLGVNRACVVLDSKAIEWLSRRVAFSPTELASVFGVGRVDSTRTTGLPGRP